MLCKELGNQQGNENPFVFSLIVIWFRYHNLRARQYKQVNPNWDDERLFNEARKWTVAAFQVSYNSSCLPRV